VLVPGCGSARSPLRDHFTEGIDRIQHTRDWHKLRRELEETLQAIRNDRDGRPRRIALAGFAAMVASADAEIAFEDNDSGNVPVAARDAERHYRAGMRSARLLRAAGRMLRVPVGELRGF
jgi:hypothetical protein